LTISGTTFYTTGSLGASTGTPLTSGTISPGPASVTVNPGGSNNSVLFLDLGIAGQVFANTRTQTFSGMGTVAINVQQTITLSDANGPVLTGTFTPVPEPETYAAVAALGLVGFGLWRRRNA
jgi:MYXO-CTERM domain-containing protein